MNSDLQYFPRRTGSAVADTSRTAGLLRMAATLAAPFSGTTLFALLLARHPLLSSDGETFPYQDHPVACSCGQLQVDCPYYRQEAHHMLGPYGRTWNPALFTPHPVYSRYALVDKAVGRQWSSGALRLAQRYLRSLIPAWRRQDRDFVAAHMRFMENSLRCAKLRSTWTASNPFAARICSRVDRMYG
jgi:hypothetical protein